ncbi:unnamed protein product [Arabidopsis thaliana]|nr:unnamed protein product [Arabidopsis thaliana]
MSHVWFHDLSTLFLLIYESSITLQVKPIRSELVMVRYKDHNRRRIEEWSKRWSELVGSVETGRKSLSETTQPLFKTPLEKLCPVLISMALPWCLKTGVLTSPAAGFNHPSDSGFAVPTKLLSIRKGDRERLRIQAVFSFPPRNGGAEKRKQLKHELVEAIEPLERGATASPDDQLLIDQLARKVEAVNPTKEPLKSDLINGKWELIYTTSAAILQAKVTGDLTPLNSKTVAVKLQVFKILGFIPVKAPDGTARGELEITYVDEELRSVVNDSFSFLYGTDNQKHLNLETMFIFYRISRGKGNLLFILKMFDPTYRIPL